MMRVLPALVIALLSWPAGAELRVVEIRVSGLDCASCVKSVPTALRRVRGVQATEYRAAEGVVEISLARGNTVTLDRLRDALKGLGYTPEDARIQVVGEVRTEEGSAVLVCDAAKLRFPLDVPQHPAIRKLIGTAGEDRIVVEGDVPKKTAPSGHDILRVRTARFEDEDE
ncbi:MAG: heavy-metal-associated domain-containing protein [Bryobacterales bacterium]|nr:heavy-metal-associated domain-containing protein [Bryobacterales bacterium]